MQGVEYSNLTSKFYSIVCFALICVSVKKIHSYAIANQQNMKSTNQEKRHIWLHQN